MQKIIPEILHNAKIKPITLRLLRQNALDRNVIQSEIAARSADIVKTFTTKQNYQKFVAVPPVTRLMNALEETAVHFYTTKPTLHTHNKLSEDVEVNLESSKRLLQDFAYKHIYKRSQYEIPSNPYDFDHNLQLELDSFLNNLLSSMISLRTILDHFRFLLESTEGTYPRPVINSSPLSNIINYAIDDVSTICTEKFGEAPKVVIQQNKEIEMICDSSHVYFIFVELLKNSMRATLDHKVSSPVIVKLDVAEETVRIKIRDEGGGIKKERIPFMFHYFFSTAPVSVPTYTYSGNFGAPFMGLGCGLPLSRLYAQFMGGTLNIQSEENKGTEVDVQLKTTGDVVIPFEINTND